MRGRGSRRSREKIYKLAYAGPPGCGKTTNLLALREVIGRQELSGIVSSSVSSIGTAPIDFLGFEVSRPGSRRIVFRITTLPRIEDYRSLWRMVLYDSHGVVVVMDSRIDMIEENRICLRRITESMARREKENVMHALPIVLQYNKSDLPGAVPKELLDRRLNHMGAASIRACAQRGEGVLSTFVEIGRRVMEASGRGRRKTGTREGLPA